MNTERKHTPEPCIFDEVAELRAIVNRDRL
jgi:hypothetical protein